MAINMPREPRAAIDVVRIGNGAWYHREARTVVEGPDLAAVFRRIRHNPLRAGNHDLRFPLLLDYQRRAVRLAKIGIRRPQRRTVGLPNRLAGAFVDRHDELLVRSVAGQHQQLATQHRRTAGAHKVIDGKLTLPNDGRLLRVDTTRTVTTKVAIQSTVFDYGRWRRVAVQRMNRLGFVDADQFHVVHQLARLAIDTHGPQRYLSGHFHGGRGRHGGNTLFEYFGIAAALNGGGHPDLVASDYRRRPPAARNSRFPAYALLFAPSQGRGVRDVTLPIGPAKLRPAGFLAVGNGGQDYRNCDWNKNRPVHRLKAPDGVESICHASSLPQRTRADELCLVGPTHR